MANFSHSAAGVVTNDTTTVLSHWSSFIMNNEKWHNLLSALYIFNTSDKENVIIFSSKALAFVQSL